MKKTLLFSLLMMIASTAFSQYHNYMELIDNKGNRTQTYPNVTEINPEIQQIINEVDTVAIYNSVAWMQQYVRDAYSPEALLTQNWLVEQYEEIGLDPSVFYFFADYPNNDTLDAGNVVAVQRGTKYPDEYIIVSSHYDHPDGPGADDNASGTAGVLEIARVLNQYSFDRSIIYINFNVEENGQIGALEFSKECARQNMNILGVFNLDMIGWYPPEYDTLKMFTSCYHTSRNLYDFYVNVANLYLPESPTGWKTEGETGAGDHHCFFLYEYPALYIGDIEYIHQNPCYHRDCDTIGNGFNNFALARAFVQATMAATIELANGTLPPQNLAATCDGQKINVRWDEVADASSYKLFKDNELLAELTENHYEDNEADDGEMREYHVVAVLPDGFETLESNHDIMRVTQPLTLPFFNDFEENTDGFVFCDTMWKQNDDTSYGDHALANVSGMPIDYFTYAETDWFSIPNTSPAATLAFDYYLKGNNFSGNFGNLPYHMYHFMVEVTTDRIHWHKVDVLAKTSPFWKKCEVSLNDFIGEPYVQIRFLVENLSNSIIYGKNGEKENAKVIVDNFTIDFSGLDVIDNEYITFNKLEICPNPASSQIEVFTDIEGEYNVSIYNLMGIKVYENQCFENGNIDISSLASGIYFLKVTKGSRSIAKRIVVE